MGINLTSSHTVRSTQTEKCAWWKFIRNVKYSTGASQELNFIGKTQSREKTDLRTYCISLFVELIPMYVSALQKLFGLNMSWEKISQN